MSIFEIREERIADVKYIINEEVLPNFMFGKAQKDVFCPGETDNICDAGDNVLVHNITGDIIYAWNGDMMACPKDTESLNRNTYKYQVFIKSLPQITCGAVKSYLLVEACINAGMPRRQIFGWERTPSSAIGGDYWLLWWLMDHIARTEVTITVKQ